MKRNSKPPVVDPKFGGGNNVRSNSMAVPAKTEDDVIVKNEILASSSSCWGGGSDNFKSEVYRLWESYRTFREKNFEAMITASYKLTGSSPSNYGPMKLGSITQFKAESPLEFSPSISIPTPMGFPIQVKPTSSARSKYWSPEDDGIQINLSSSSTTVSTDQSSREDVGAHMTKALYGNTNPRNNRLQMFEEICPQD